MKDCCDLINRYSQVYGPRCCILEIKEIRDGYHPSNPLKRSKCDDKVPSKKKTLPDMHANSDYSSRW